MVLVSLAQPLELRSVPRVDGSDSGTTASDSSPEEAEVLGGWASERPDRGSLGLAVVGSSPPQAPIPTAESNPKPTTNPEICGLERIQVISRGRPHHRHEQRDASTFRNVPLWTTGRCLALCAETPAFSGGESRL